jgi:hypothetical protein
MTLRFRRLKVHKQLPMVRAALAALQTKRRGPKRWPHKNWPKLDESVVPA